MGMSQRYRHNPGDRQEIISLMRAAVACGVTFLDTAEVYGLHLDRAGKRLMDSLTEGEVG
jgi:aryl-alcohol dehydrogenase-like predicted oxidoreductase